jgi:NADPH:quinone reductase-like Zn-dependent oxidoreductase
MHMDALVLHPTERTVGRETVPVPTPGCFELLVQVEAVALNPVDSLYVRHPLANSKRIIGSDFAGSVASLGKDVPASSNIQVGDRVAGFLQGACSVNVRPGAFAKYVVVPWDLVWKVPTGCSIEEAAGVSLAALTAAQGVWYRLGLQAPFKYDEASVLTEHPEWTASRRSDPAALVDVFIYGASTSVGLLAAQLVRISTNASGQKLRLSGAASKTKWEMLRSEPYCYENLVDYHDDTWPHTVLGLVGGRKFLYAYDCISEGSSVEKVSSLLVDDGMMGIVRSREGGAWHAHHLPKEPIYGAVWEGLGEEVQYQGFTVPRSPSARQFAVRFYSWLGEAIGSAVQPVPVRSMPGGLEGITNDGFSLLGFGQMDDRVVQRTEPWMRPISGEKLVYRL